MKLMTAACASTAVSSRVIAHNAARHFQFFVNMGSTHFLPRGQIRFGDLYGSTFTGLHLVYIRISETKKGTRPHALSADPDYVGDQP